VCLRKPGTTKTVFGDRHGEVRVPHPLVQLGRRRQGKGSFNRPMSISAARLKAFQIESVMSRDDFTGKTAKIECLLALSGLAPPFAQASIRAIRPSGVFEGAGGADQAGISCFGLGLQRDRRNWDGGRRADLYYSHKRISDCLLAPAATKGGRKAGFAGQAWGTPDGQKKSQGSFSSFPFLFV